MRANVCEESSSPIDNWGGSVFFVLIAIMPPGLDVAVVSDSMVVSAGRVGEGLGAIGARIGLLAGVDVLMCFEMEFGRKALSAIRADNRAGGGEQVSRVHWNGGEGRRTESSSERS
jgi:hypothetical protein